MVKKIDLQELARLQSLIDAGRIGDFYSDLIDKGYSYAAWAKGVANGETLAGISALDYMHNSAMMGGNGTDCRNLSAAAVSSIKIGMAKAYLKSLENIASMNQEGLVDRDVNAVEVWRFHEDVFLKNGLSINNWTLHVPFKIYEEINGEAALEKFWEVIRSTGGDGLDATAINALIMLDMYGYAYGPSGIVKPEHRAMAKEWLDNLPPVLSGFFPIYERAEAGALTPQFIHDLATVSNQSEATIEIVQNIGKLFDRVDKPMEPAYFVGMALTSLARQAVSATAGDAFLDEITRITHRIGNEQHAKGFLDDIYRLVHKTEPGEGNLFEMSMQMLTDERTQGKFDVFNLNSQGSDLEGTISTAMTDSDKGLAYRYAILRGNPFVILGADYQPYVGELTLYDPQTATGLYTEAQLRDRLIALGVFTADAAAGGHGTVSPPFGLAFHRWGDALVRDHATGQTVTVDGYDLGIINPNVLEFGGAGKDHLSGLSRDDRLYGGDEEDRLEGKGGSDYLEGGQGHDTYVLSSDDSGVDTIVDIDGDGHLEVDGQSLDGMVFSRPNIPIADDNRAQVYQDSQGQYRLQQLSDDGVWELAARGSDGYRVLARLQNWQDGMLGMQLNANVPGVTPEPERFDFYHRDAPVFQHYIGTHASAGIWVHGSQSRSGQFTGSGHGDVIYTGGGNSNLVYAFGGSDYVQGGEGRDFLIMGVNRSQLDHDEDVAYGGGGSDIIAGGGGNDTLWGGDGSASYLQADAGTDSDDAQMRRGDWISGQAGSDLIYGSAREDVLFGGDGDDTLRGGAGRDLLLGDADYFVGSGSMVIGADQGTAAYQWQADGSVRRLPNGHAEAAWPCPAGRSFAGAGATRRRTSASRPVAAFCAANDWPAPGRIIWTAEPATTGWPARQATTCCTAAMTTTCSTATTPWPCPKAAKATTGCLPARGETSCLAALAATCSTPASTTATWTCCAAAVGATNSSAARAATNSTAKTARTPCTPASAAAAWKAGRMATTTTPAPATTSCSTCTATTPTISARARTKSPTWAGTTFTN
nr:hypothetical protein [Vandammella animalimorsus]